MKKNGFVKFDENVVCKNDEKIVTDGDQKIGNVKKLFMKDCEERKR